MSGLTWQKQASIRFIRYTSALAHNLTGYVPSSELVFAEIFRSATQSMGVKLPPIYPVKAAANYGLLYLICRIAIEIPDASILELGAGDSTKLLHALGKATGSTRRVVTLESDEQWANSIRPHVGHEVMYSPLVEKPIFGRDALGFMEIPDGRFTVIIVDGPPGSKRQSRWAALDVLQDNLGEDFIVIFDDAERVGEMDTIRAFLSLPQAKGAQVSLVMTHKVQLVISSQKYSYLKYF